MVLFVTIIISFARVINAPKKLLANPTENVARYIPNIQILTSRDDANNSTEALSNNQNDTVVSNNTTTVVNGIAATNNTAVNVTNVSLGNGNSTEVDSNNSTSKNNETKVVLPESCKGLDIIYGNDAEAYSHWWKNVNSLDGKTF